jgi:hypothetical protein
MCLAFHVFMNWYTWFQGIVLLTYSYVRAQFVGAMGSLSLGLCCPSPVLIPFVYIYIYIYIYTCHTSEMALPWWPFWLKLRSSAGPYFSLVPPTLEIRIGLR